MIEISMILLIFSVEIMTSVQFENTRVISLSSAPGTLHNYSNDTIIRIMNRFVNCENKIQRTKLNKIRELAQLELDLNLRKSGEESLFFKLRNRRTMETEVRLFPLSNQLSYWSFNWSCLEKNWKPTFFSNLIFSFLKIYLL